MNRVESVLDAISRKKLTKPWIIAIDGRCASGKTTLSQMLQTEIGCNVVHIDDFYLPFARRTVERMEQLGGNIDRERLACEVIEPLRCGEIVRYRPFDCHNDRFLDETIISPGNGVVVEGAFSCHPDLWNYYDLRVFLSVLKDEQIKRLTARNSDSVSDFTKLWIPNEERYFTACKIMERCDLVLN